VNRAAAAPSDALLRPLQQQVDETERAAIAAALRATGGNRVATAKLLGMSRAALYVRLERHPELTDLGR
jgi:DNA-binding NtrC family response regulator